MKPVEVPNWLWVGCAIAGGVLQTFRNVMQRQLTGRLGTIGAAHVRFLYGLPVGLAALGVALLLAGPDAISIPPSFWAWVLLGALTQIGATALMLAAMRERSFVVATAYLKTEPLQIVVFGVVFLGEVLSLQSSIAVALATFGVILMTLPQRVSGQADAAPPASRAALLATLRPAAFGIASGAGFALAAIGFRGSVLALGDAPFYLRATVTLASTLAIQSLLLSAWLQWRSPGVMREVLRAWRPSTIAGGTGALASVMWFLAFSLQTAAAVRTVGLLEILFAQVASRQLFAQRLSGREAAGIAMMMIGLVMLLRG